MSVRDQEVSIYTWEYCCVHFVDLMIVLFFGCFVFVFPICFVFYICTFFNCFFGFLISVRVLCIFR